MLPHALSAHHRRTQYIPAFVPFDFICGTAVRHLWRHRNKADFEARHSAVAAGMISGEGFAAVMLALFQFCSGWAPSIAIDYSGW